MRANVKNVDQFDYQMIRKFFGIKDIPGIERKWEPGTFDIKELKRLHFLSFMEHIQPIAERIERELKLLRMRVELSGNKIPTLNETSEKGLDMLIRDAILEFSNEKIPNVHELDEILLDPMIKALVGNKTDLTSYDIAYALAERILASLEPVIGPIMLLATKNPNLDAEYIINIIKNAGKLNHKGEVKSNRKDFNEKMLELEQDLLSKGIPIKPIGLLKMVLKTNSDYLPQKDIPPHLKNDFSDISFKTQNVKRILDSYRAFKKKSRSIDTP